MKVGKARCKEGRQDGKMEGRQMRQQAMNEVEGMEEGKAEREGLTTWQGRQTEGREQMSEISSKFAKAAVDSSGKGAFENSRARPKDAASW